MALCGFVGLTFVVVFIGMLSIAGGLLTGMVTKSTPAASLVSCLLYSIMLISFCLYLYRTIPDPTNRMDAQLATVNADMRSQSIAVIIGFGAIAFAVGGFTCAVIPVLQQRVSRHR